MELHVHLECIKIWMGLINIGAQVVSNRKFVADSLALLVQHQVSRLLVLLLLSYLSSMMKRRRRRTWREYFQL